MTWERTRLACSIAIARIQHASRVRSQEKKMNDQWKRRPHLTKEKARQAGTPGWYSRGYLPHFSGDQVTQTVTFRLLDSMPQSVLDRWRGELKHLPGELVVFRRRPLSVARVVRDAQSRSCI